MTTMKNHRERVLVTGGSGFIGRHLITALELAGFETSSIDLFPCPVQITGRAEIVDICDFDQLQSFVTKVNPDYVIHLAAYASLTASIEEMRKVNVLGTRNLIRSLPPNVKSTVYASTQLVVTMGDDPGNGFYHNPYTPYGETKAEMERLIRSEAPRPWIIIRPGNIWGPHHPTFAQAIFKYIAKGVYLHPAGKPVYRSYCYVRNCAQQVIDLMLAPEARNGVFYVSEQPIDSGMWVDGLSMALRGRKARRVPIWLLRVLGASGDLIRRCGLSSPIDSGRVLRMTNNYAVPTEATLAIVNPPSVSFEEGINETKEWLIEVWNGEQKCQ